MYQRTCITAFFIALLQMTGSASGEPSFPFVDGRWSGEIETNPNSSVFNACKASTTYSDGTMLALAKRNNGSWHLQLSNPGWQLPTSHQYDMIALVDYHPQQVRTTAETKSKTRLEIANLDQISLLGLIENGHMIDLSADGFNVRYDLEGSAKVIQRIRNCFANRN